MKRKENFLLQTVGGEKLLVPLGAQVIDLNGLIILNETAARVWELLAEEQSVEELSTAVMERFDVTADVARHDVRAFVEEIARLGLLEQ